ncbi:MAG: transferrin-binding protein-like solute binding protein, partial [Neisseria sp.]|nr:transferrin-binding protein-like solute binding protein [Neisseria sp.]
HDGVKSETANRTRDTQFVQSGYIQGYSRGYQKVGETKEYGPSALGYVYYFGTNPAKNLPTSNSITYKGTWDFVTDAVKARSSNRISGLNSEITADTARSPARNYGATSFHESVNSDKTKGEVGHSSEFSVNFADKTLTGKLMRNAPTSSPDSQEKNTRYTISANIKGNRFVGKATAVEKPDFFKNANGEFPSDLDLNADRLEGGFFGNNAEELAGKFMSNDNSLFGVFAAKRGEAETTPTYDAVSVAKNDFSKTELDTYGNVLTKLVINGKEFDLLPSAIDASKTYQISEHALADGKKLSIYTCCNNLSFVKFGTYQLGGNLYNFLQGERTSLADMNALSGSLTYKGNWLSSVLLQGGQAFQPSGSAEFNVNLSDKTLTGSLLSDNKSSVFNITGTVDKNGFTGTASTPNGGFNLDTGGSQYLNAKAEVTGGFYGPQATELGGVFHTKDASKDQVGGVFGAKRQVAAQ